MKEEQVYFKLRQSKKELERKQKEETQREGITPGLTSVLLHKSQTHCKRVC